MSYSLYLFDFDYTLVNSEEGILKCFRLTLDQYHLPQVPDDVICKTIGLPMEEAVHIITGYEDAARIDAFIEDYRALADRYMTPSTHFFPETLPVLRALRDRGASIGIISSKTRSRIEEKFAETGTRDLIDRIIGIEDVKTPKPSPEGIEAALRAFALPKAQTLYIGDSVVDAGAAQNAGVAFAAVCTGTTPAAAFAPYPHAAILDDLRGLRTLAVGVPCRPLRPITEADSIDGRQAED